ncbi:diguanylate phosphodiesterase [Gemmatimonadetes bacterium T265]|nr:diguanylate phosphodiesterase [Gemmatimonadetes bacterium T265]
MLVGPKRSARASERRAWRRRNLRGAARGGYLPPALESSCAYVCGPNHALRDDVSVDSLSLASTSRSGAADRTSAADELGSVGTAAELALDTHFQPIAAVRRGDVVGVEALTRGRRADGELVTPAALFTAAARAGRSMDLDRECRRVALRRFAPLHEADRTLVCFVNCHVATFLADVDGPHAWTALAAASDVDRRALALEVLESEAADLGALAAATARYRADGFLVVIDDVGAGHSNLDRIAAVHPDMLKADRSLVRGCAHDRVKRAVLRALVGLTEELGGWLVVEGVEDEADALTVLDLGADLVQGYHIARPAAIPTTAGLDEPRRRVVALAGRHRAATRERVLQARGSRARRAEFARGVSARLARLDAASWEQALCIALADAPGDPNAASAVVLDDAGRQLTPTVRQRGYDAPERALIFRAPDVGADHTLKEYVYLLPDAAGATYETTPYVPLPNETICVTVSTAFADPDGARRLLCLHLDADLPDGPIDSGPPADSLGR